MIAQLCATESLDDQKAKCNDQPEKFHNWLFGQHPTKSGRCDFGVAFA
jgi:hypothetical protein